MRPQHHNPNPPSREQQLATARSLDENSTVLINFAVKSVKKHPVVFSSYVVGLLICLFMSGIALTVQQQSEFETDLQSINYADLDNKQRAYQSDYQQYYAAKGWLSCDAYCQDRKQEMERSKVALDQVQRQVDVQLSDAKAKLGLLSSVGVGEQKTRCWDVLCCHEIWPDECVSLFIKYLLFCFVLIMIGETRDMFWTRFSQGIAATAATLSLRV